MNPNTPNPSRARRLPGVFALMALVCLGVVAVLGSCNIVGPVGYFVMGPPDVEAQFPLDPKRPTVVFIDDGVNRSVMPTRASRRRIGMTADDYLLNQGKFERVIASQDLLAMVEREKYSKTSSVVEVGEGINAEILIHVAMDSFTIVQSGDNFTPTASCRVRVVDIKEKKQLWPEKLDDWHPLAVNAPPHRGELPAGPGGRAKLQDELAQRVGRDIAFLFFKHEMDQSPGGIDH